MPRAGTAVVDTSGIADLVRDLRKLDKPLAKALTDELKDIGAQVAREAGTRAPRRTGALARSIKPSVRRGQVFIRSRLPYAGLLEYGGTIRPRGTPITFKESAFIRKSITHQAARIENQLGDMVENVARRYAEFK